MILRVASFPTKVCAQSPEAFQCLLGRRAYTTMPSSHGFDAYCRKAEQGGTVERVCVALDVGLEMHDAFDARRPDGPTRLAVVLPALRTWISQKAVLAPKTQWGLVVLRDAEAELLLAPTERDIMLATLNSVAQPRPRDAFEEEDDGVADAPFDFSSLYNVLGDAFGTARPDGAVDRCLVVFGRSRAVPVATGEFTLKTGRRRLLPGRHLRARERGAARPRRPGRLYRAPEPPDAPEILRHGDDALAGEAQVLPPPAAGAPHTARRAGRRAREVGSRGGAADGVAAAADGRREFARGADLAAALP